MLGPWSMPRVRRTPAAVAVALIAATSCAVPPGPTTTGGVGEPVGDAGQGGLALGADAGTCEEGRTGYTAFLASLQSGANISGCNVDSDCRLVALDNECGASCGTAVSVRGAETLVSSTDAYAAAHCAACPPRTPCPPVEQFAVCSGGTCTAY